MACDEATARKIIDTMYETISITKALKRYNINPNTFFALVHTTPELENYYSRAQVAIGEMVVGELIEISDTEEDPQKARNRIDTRKWFASKARPDKYGDRLDVNVNQVVSITDALTAAKSRTRNVSEIELTQPVNHTEQLSIPHTGPKPVAKANSLKKLDPSIKTLKDVLD